jgi:hypothetical protein
MRKTVLVAIVLSISLVFGGLAVSANQVWIGNRVLQGNSLLVGLTATEDHLRGSVVLPCSGYLSVFYQGSPETEQYMIFPNPQNRCNYMRAGMNILPLSMLYPTGNLQKLTVIFSPFKLWEINFYQGQSPYLSASALGTWCNVCCNSIWVGERSVLAVPITTLPECRTTAVNPPVCVQTTSCCPSTYQPSCCAIDWWWLMIGIIIVH